jgi:hypothetical protein
VQKKPGWMCARARATIPAAIRCKKPYGSGYDDIEYVRVDK